MRQRLALGRVVPFVESGLFEVGDQAGLALALGIGAGVDLRLDDRYYAGANAVHYLSGDSDELGGLDWSVGAHLGVRLGAGYATRARRR